MDHEERNRRFIQKQLKIAKASDAREDFRPTKLQRTEKNAKLSLNLSISDKSRKAKSIEVTSAFEDIEEKECSQKADVIHQSHKKMDESCQKSDVDAEDAENWVVVGIIVKVLNGQVGEGKYRNKKGVIERVDDEYCAMVRMLDSSDVLQLDQDDLETVIPKEGNKVVILRGKQKNQIAEIVSIAMEQYSATLRLVGGPQRYEHYNRSAPCSF